MIVKLLLLISRNLSTFILLNPTTTATFVAFGFVDDVVEIIAAQEPLRVNDREKDTENRPPTLQMHQLPTINKSLL